MVFFPDGMTRRPQRFVRRAGPRADHRFAILSIVFLLLLSFDSTVYAQSVLSGQTAYRTTTYSTRAGPPNFTASVCLDCHINSNPGVAPITFASVGHLNASNNPGQILFSITSGSMTTIYNSTDIPAADRFNLALFIGQYKLPITSNSTIRTRANVVGVRDVYALLPTNGSSGVARDVAGVTATNGTNGTTSVSVVAPSTTSLAYNISYTPNANFVGTDSFSYSVINPTGTGTSTIAVTVVGITSAATANATTNQAFSFQITTNGTPSGANPYSASGLPAGLSVNTATGLISGTPTVAGSSNVALSVNTTDGLVTQTLVINVVFVGFTSATTANGTQGQAFGYQITTNGTLSGANPYSASGLPSGLSVNTATGLISGTPPFGASTNVTVGVVTTVGSFTQTVAINIAFAGVPLISSPIASSPVDAALNQVLSPIQIVASNPPISSYGAIGLPPGLSLDTTTGLITGTPTQTGAFNVTFSATNGAGTGTSATAVTFTVRPISGALSLTVQLNTPTTINLASVITGTLVTGVNIVTAPSRGTATVNGTRVTYTPVFNFFGNDSFSFVAFSSGATSLPGLVTITIVGRPDPTADTAVTGLISAQSDTARRFAGSQISNFQRRLESLHRRGDNAKNAGSGFNATVGRPVAGVSPITRADNRNFNPSTGDALSDKSPLLRVSNTATGPRTLDTTGASPIPFVQDALTFLTARSLNLASLAAEASGGPATHTLGVANYWVEGNVSFGKRDATATRSALDFSTDGISAGVDFQVSDSLTLGVGLGYARAKDDIGNDGTQNRAHGYSISAYGSYQPSAKTFIDALLGIGTLDFDTRRFVAPINSFASGDRDGHQLFSSIAAGYEHRDNGVLISPYLRLDYSAERLNTGTESGVGPFALTYFKQTSHAFQGALGVRAQSIHETNFGLAEPRLRIEYRHDFQGERQSSIAYADLVGTRYSFATRVDEKDSLVLGIGSDFVFHNGVKLGIDYQLQQNFSDNTDQAIRFSLSKDLDAGKLPAARLSALTHTEPLDIQIEAGYQFDDNITRSRSDPDILSDSTYSANLGLPFVFLPNPNTRALLTFSVGGERFRSYEKLSRLSGGVRGELQYRPSSEFHSPTLAVFAQGFADQFESRLRDGFRYTAGVSVLQPITDRISVFGAVVHNQRFARSAVFDTRDYSGRLNVDYALTPTGTIYLAGEYRRGDANTTSSSSLENIDIATVFTNEDAFPNRNFSVYRFDAKTVLGTLGYNWGIGPRDSLDFSWRRIETTPDFRPSFATSPRNYIVNQYSIIYLVRF